MKLMMVILMRIQQKISPKFGKADHFCPSIYRHKNFNFKIRGENSSDRFFRVRHKTISTIENNCAKRADRGYLFLKCNFLQYKP